jgi:molybdate transport system substrate-binding protein
MVVVRRVYTTVYYPSYARVGVCVRCLKVALSLLALATNLTVASTVVLAADVTVFAAASLKEAMDDQAKQFSASSGDKVVVSYGASNTLAKQIEAGAPADIFISADLDWMDYLDQKHLVAPNARFNLLRNTLVLIAPSSSTSSLKIGPHIGLAAALGKEKLAMANPDSVPAGKYGKSALEKLGVWADVEKQVARAENVRAALALVSRGEAPFGIVYETDALADKGVRVVDTFPPDTYPPIVYPAAVLAASKSGGAGPLLDYLRSAAARPVWEKYGFGLAQ